MSMFESILARFSSFSRVNRHRSLELRPGELAFKSTMVISAKSINDGESKFASNWIPLLLGAGLGVATAYLLMDGSWHFALALLFTLPAFIVLHKYPFISLIVWLLLAPFLMETPSTSGRTLYTMIHRALPPATVIIIVLSSLFRLSPRRLPRLGWAEFAMAGYVILSIISILLLNDDPNATMVLFYDRVFIPMCLYLIVRLSVPNIKDLQRLVPVALIMAVSQSIIGLISWSAPQVLPPAWLTHLGERATGSLGSPSVYTATLMFSCLVLLHAAVKGKSGIHRTLYLFACFMALFGVFFSFSRASWLGGIFVIFCLLFLYPKDFLRLSFIVLPVTVLFIGGGLLSNEFQFAGQRMYSEQSEESALSRLPVFLAAYRMFETKPVFGWGYGNFDRFDRQFQLRVGDLVSPEKDHASHNVYLTLLAEQGLTGLLLFLTPLFVWLFVSMRKIGELGAEGFMGNKFLIMLWLFVFFYIILNNFSNVKVVFSLGLYWIALALIAHIVQTTRSTGEPEMKENPDFEFSKYIQN